MGLEDNLLQYRDVPARQLLARILPHIPGEAATGIRRVALLDGEYQPRRDGKRLAARYVPIPGTKMADIEIFVGNCIDGIPPSLRSNPVFLTWLFAGRLLHELFHHVVHGQQRISRPSAKAEERHADRWAHKEAGRILFSLFPFEQHRDDYARVQDILDAAG